MSLILEALRKSEAERRLGSAPDVLAAMPVLHAPAARRRPHWLIAGALLIVAGLAAGAWWMHASTVPAVVATVPVRAADAGVTNDAGLASGHPAAAVPFGHPEASAPAAAMPPDRLPALPPAVVSTHPATPPAIQPPAPGARATPIATATAPPASENAPVQPAVVIPEIAPAARTPAPPPVPSSDEPPLPSIADLMPDERAGLPPLKITMHVYAGEPANRFMIIDGQRVVEGASLGGDVVLVRIRRDGAEIAAHGRHLLLPNP